MTAAAVARPRVNDDEIREWRHLDATKAFLADLKERVEEGKASWASQQYQKDTLEQTALANAQALGGMKVLQTLIEFLEGDE